MEEFEFVVPDAIQDDVFKRHEYNNIMGGIRDGYSALVQLGANPQDARGVLPTNVSTNIIAGANLRTLSEMARIRLCTRTQGEYQDVFREVRKLVIGVHPWAEPFLRVACAADGVCCFPNYAECPIKPGVFNPDTGRRWDGKDEEWEGSEGTIYYPAKPLTRNQIQELWEQTRFEAVPKETK
jgi:hypothetical protein